MMMMMMMGGIHRISGCTAYDLILVHKNTATVGTTDTTGSIISANSTTTNHTHKKQPPSNIGASECLFRFGSLYSSSTSSTSSTSSSSSGSNNTNETLVVYLVVHHNQTGDTLRFPISIYNTILQQQQQQQQQADNTVIVGEALQQRQHDPLALQTLMDALTTTTNNTGSTTGTTSSNHCGPYKANFILMSITDHNNSDHDPTTTATTRNETILGIAPFRIFIYPCHTTKLAIVDVDGTITTSTLSGFWNTAVLQDYSTRHCHYGICSFLNKFVETIQSPPQQPSAVVSSSSSSSSTTTATTTNAISNTTTTKTTTTPSPSVNSFHTIQLIYLTNRPITYVDATRSLLNELQDDDMYTLPKGPLIGFTGNLAGVFKMDFYHANAHEFKYNTLEKYVLQPFLDVGVTTTQQILYAGFGNTLYDMYAYHRAGIPTHRMFIIDKQSRIYACDASVQSLSPDSSNDSNNEESNQNVTMLLDHPKKYESMKGTMFAAGYLDPNLMTYISNLK